MPAKGSTEWDGLSSPDLWDAICFAFLENVSYTVAEGRATEGEDLACAVAAKADDMFADV
jgi:hypothetical protein